MFITNVRALAKSDIIEKPLGMSLSVDFELILEN